MKRRITFILIYTILAFVCASGCHTNETVGAMGSEVWTEAPKLTYGVLESEKLEILPWNSGRCEATSCGMMAETENGYYLIYGSWLWYADKGQLDRWIILCGKPDCTHLEGDCNGFVSSSGFHVRDREILFAGQSSEVPDAPKSNGNGLILISMDPDGTNKKTAYDPAVTGWSVEGSTANLLLPDQWLIAATELDTSGRIHAKIYCITETGSKQILDVDDGPGIVTLFGAKNIFSLYGDKYFCCNLLDDTGTRIFRVEDGKILSHGVAGLPTRGGYLSGNTLRCFRPGDGYYDIDLVSREEIRLGDAQLENSYSAVVLPNCILESTLLFPVSTENRMESMEHSATIFDGESWRNVELPEQLRYASESVYITVQAVTADGILLACRDSKTVYKTTGTVFYYISLQAEELAARYCAEVVLPKPENR